MTNDERIKLACSELTHLASVMLKQSMENMIGLFTETEPSIGKSQENTSENTTDNGLNKSLDNNSTKSNPGYPDKTENSINGYNEFEDYIDDYEDYIDNDYEDYFDDDYEDYFDDDYYDYEDHENECLKDDQKTEFPEISEDGFCEDIYDENPFTGNDCAKNDKSLKQRDDNINVNENGSSTENLENQINPDTPLENLEFSVRTYNCLKRAGLKTVGDLFELSYDKMVNIRNLGKKCYKEVSEKIIEISDEYKKSKNSKGTYQTEPKSQEIKPRYMEKLNELIGLEEVKEQVKKINAFVKMKRDMPENSDVPMVLNMEFIGNPGTAKTTVARIMAGLLYETGILKSDKIVEVGRSELVAKYVGQTAVQVKSIFDRAEGKLLFIDEAYSLAESVEGDFGDEAINTIVQEMENRRDKTVVVFAGYPDKMEAFFDRNPGLRSRVPFKITFNDYTEEEMYKISEIEASRRGFTLSSEAIEKVIGLYKNAAQNPNMGNGRYCRNMVESAILNFALRKYGEDTEDRQQKIDFVLEAEDFDNILNAEQTKISAPIGFRG